MQTAFCSTFPNNVRPLPSTQTVILTGNIPIKTTLPPLAVCHCSLRPSPQSRCVSGYVGDCISKQSDKCYESLQTKTFKKENPGCWIPFLSIPHSVATKRFTCHHRLPSSFNKRSKRKCLALSGRV